MKKSHFLTIVLTLLAIALATQAWDRASAIGSTSGNSNRIVGVWFVKIPEAPFQYHLFTFNADGTMQQANPDAGDRDTSDSDGKGVWVQDSNKIKGKFVEITADRTTHAFVSRGEISFEINIGKDVKTLTGTLTARFYDEGGKLIRGPLAATLSGERVTLP